MKYVVIQLEEMKEALPESDGWQWSFLGGERVARRNFKDPRTDLSIYVYTSIGLHDSAKAEKGKDCVRVIGLRQPSEKFGPHQQPLTSRKDGRVLRVQGWRKNLEARINDIKHKTWERRDWVPKR